MGVYGACRREELTNLTLDDIEDCGSVLIVKVRETKTKVTRTFTVVNNELNFLELYREYVALRPPNTNHRRFFVFYRDGTCGKQPVGKNTFGMLPSKIATFLTLPNPNLYTGHCFRRSSATLLADSGADITNLKRHGGWKSSSVAEGYIEDSIQQKVITAEKILGRDVASSSNNLSSYCSENVNILENINYSFSNTNTSTNSNNLPSILVSNCKECKIEINISKLE